MRPLRRLRMMRRALLLIEGGGCERSTRRGTACWEQPNWSPYSQYGADRWCDSCIAAAGRHGVLPPERATLSITHQRAPGVLRVEARTTAE